MWLCVRWAGRLVKIQWWGAKEWIVNENSNFLSSNRLDTNTDIWEQFAWGFWYADEKWEWGTQYVMGRNTCLFPFDLLCLKQVKPNENWDIEQEITQSLIIFFAEIIHTRKESGKLLYRFGCEFLVFLIFEKSKTHTARTVYRISFICIPNVNVRLPFLNVD